MTRWLSRRAEPPAPAPDTAPSEASPPTHRHAADGGEPRFGERLVRRGLITRSQVGEALSRQPLSGKRVGTLLVELGAIDDRQLATELAGHLDLHVADLDLTTPEAQVLQLVPEALARAHTVLPLRIRQGRIEVASADPLDSRALDAIASQTGLTVEVLVAPVEDIVRALQTSYRSLLNVDRLVQAFENLDATRRPASPAGQEDTAPVAQLVTQILGDAVRERASDIHIEPQNDRVRVRFRIDGALHDVLALPENIGPAIVSRLKIMAEMNIADRRRAQDGQMALDIDGHQLDVRVATCPTVWGEKAVLRVLDRNRVLLRLDELGMRPHAHQLFTSLVRAPLGMVICAGPTGSGKTTTLYATLSEINQTDRNVTTIEDPVEYVFPSLTQIQINEQAGLTFAGGLRAILRQDPDIILVGEIRDAETARVAVESSLTGHLVLSSLHATDACAALQRLVDMGIEPFLVASTVTGVVSQRLFRRICGSCREAHDPQLEELAFYTEHAGPGAAPIDHVWRGTGCGACGYTGFRDRVGVFELVRISEPIKRLLVDRAPVEELRATAAAEGTRSLLLEALTLVSEGVTTVGEIMRNVYGHQV